MMWRVRLRDRVWRDPLVVTVSAVLALLVMAVDADAVVRVPVTLWFFLVGPGLALVPLLDLDEFKWVGVVAGSLVVDVVVAELMLYAGVWSLAMGMGLVLVVCGVGVGFQVRRLLAAEAVSVRRNAAEAVHLNRVSATGVEELLGFGSVLAADAVSIQRSAVEGAHLNSASADELEELPGVGPVLAARIVALRDRNGSLTDTDDLLAVRGIGLAKVKAMSEAIASP